jgi:superfamily I DNA/RNA helicase
VTVAPAILQHYPDLNDAQRSIVGHLDGPLLVIAGPGSGKTYGIVLRALNLLILQKAAPREVILCTFTEKAAFEMRDRLAAAAGKVGYKGDLSELRVSTIHGLCNRLLMKAPPQRMSPSRIGGTGSRRPPAARGDTHASIRAPLTGKNQRRSMRRRAQGWWRHRRHSYEFSCCQKHTVGTTRRPEFGRTSGSRRRGTDQHSWFSV